MKRSTSQLWFVCAALLGTASFGARLPAGSASTGQGSGGYRAVAAEGDEPLCAKLKARPKADGGTGSGPRGRMMAELTTLKNVVVVEDSTLVWNAVTKKAVPEVRVLQYEGGCLAGWTVQSGQGENATILRQSYVTYVPIVTGELEGGVELAVSEWTPQRPGSAITDPNKDGRLAARQVSRYDSQYRLRSDLVMENGNHELIEYDYMNDRQDRVSGIRTYGFGADGSRILAKTVQMSYANGGAPDQVTAAVESVDLRKFPQCEAAPKAPNWCLTQRLFSYDHEGRIAQVVACPLDNEDCKDASAINAREVYSRSVDANGRLVTKVTRYGGGGAAGSTPQSETRFIER
jgi:hypothetical protein